MENSCTLFGFSFLVVVLLVLRSLLVFITCSLNARGAIETNDLDGKCLSYTYARGHKINVFL